ncbi:DUF721 domain-containing protein [Schaalia vaccimaxillae]|uniref:DUF721 domain-containing protein n=1 Tax=Schaalia vaccimaxillae TaxID=183916 RepID=UPI00047D548F|nr:DciA family protein [Schaalia vaccimaxillae]
MSDSADVTTDPPSSEGDEVEEFAARALERAQRTARSQGYIRTKLPSWELGDEPRKAGRIDGASEWAAVEAGASSAFQSETDDLSTRSKQADSDFGDADSVDPEGDLSALKPVVSRSGASWVKAPGMAAMRLQYRRTRSLGAMLKRTIRVNQWDTPTRMGSIMAKWPQIVGETVAEHCAVETFEDHKLIVRCSSTAWAKQMQLLLPTVERRIAEEVGAGVVRQVIVRGPVAPSWKKGPLSVPGRGPRDTYG